MSIPSSPLKRHRAAGLAALLLSAALAPAAVLAQAGVADAQAQYKLDVQRCNSGQTNQDRATCLREAGAALQAARQGKLSGAQGGYDSNALDRCQRLPAGQREDCIELMRSPTRTEGNVLDGGVLRMRETIVPVSPTPETPPPSGPMPVR